MELDGTLERGLSQGRPDQDLLQAGTRRRWRSLQVTEHDAKLPHAGGDSLGSCVAQFLRFRPAFLAIELSSFHTPALLLYPL